MCSMSSYAIQTSVNINSPELHAIIHLAAVIWHQGMCTYNDILLSLEINIVSLIYSSNTNKDNVILLYVIYYILGAKSKCK